VKIKLTKTVFRAGEEIEIRAASDRDTAKLTARLYGAKPVPLYWSNAEKNEHRPVRRPHRSRLRPVRADRRRGRFRAQPVGDEIRIEILGY
jgi:hypothetical protein